MYREIYTEYIINLHSKSIFKIYSYGVRHIPYPTVKFSVGIGTF